MIELHRHDLVWLDPGMDSDSIATPNLVEALYWIRLQHPLVVTRQPAMKGDSIALGFTLSPKRTRISLSVPKASIIHRMRPLLLADAIEHAPISWHEGMKKILDVCESAGAAARVYGSLSFQAFTNQDYLDEESDLDLLLECNEHTRFDDLLPALKSISLPKLDGEIKMPNGWAVAWRELSITASVLAKSDSEVRLFPAREFLAGKC